MTDIKREHLDAVINGSEQDFNYISRLYTPSIISIANKYRKDCMPLEDAVQEGYIGLFKAILSYRDDTDAKFTTYAKKCIQNNILTAVKKSQGLGYLLLSNARPLDESILLQSFEDDVLIREQNAEYVKIARERLSKFEFLVFSLYIRGYSQKEMARFTHTNEKSIGNAMQRIHKKLSK